MSHESNAVQLYGKLQNATEITNLGLALGKSGAFGLDRAEGGIVVLMTCACEGISPVQYSRKYDTVGGKPRKKAMAAYAEFRVKGGKVKWLATGNDCKRAEAEFTFEGATTRYAYTIEDAKRAQLLKPNSGWDKNPQNMLRSRVLSNGLGMIAPEIFAGDDEDYEAAPVMLDLTPGLKRADEIIFKASESHADKQTAIREARTAIRAEATPAPAPAPAAPVVEIAATVSRTEPPQDTPALAAAGLAPVEPTPAPVHAPAPTTSHSMTGSGAYISPATAAKVEELVGPHFEKAMAWFVKEKWLAEGESILRLTETRAQRILKQASSWLRAIGAEGGAK